MPFQPKAHLSHVVPPYRCAIGLESPQLATDMLLGGKYQPLFTSDMWALGQLGLRLTGRQQPEEHRRLHQGVCG